MKQPKTKKINLLQTQRLMAAIVMRPLTKDWELNRKWSDGRPTAAIVAPLIKPNDRLTALERIEIYNKQYWFRLIECFSDDFPGLRGILGEKKFDTLTLHYLHAHPSKSYTLRNLGQFLIPFLIAHPTLTAPRNDLALNMAQFEWAQVEAFDGPSRPALTAADIAAQSQNPAQLKLSLQPYLQLLHLRYPLDDFLVALKRKDAAMRTEASNAMSEKSATKKSRTVRIPRPKETFLAVHRFHNVLYYKRLTAEAYITLTALRKGMSLEKALQKAISASKNPTQNWAALIQQWFAEWTQLGWFCKPARETKK